MVKHMLGDLHPTFYDNDGKIWKRKFDGLVVRAIQSDGITTTLLFLIYLEFKVTSNFYLYQTCKLHKHD